VKIGSRSAVNLLACVLLMASSALQAAIAPSADAVQPLQIGDPAPDFTAHRVDHTAYTFAPTHLAKPHVLIFYRGGWCPYCNRQLADLHLVEPKLRAAGFEVLFLSTDRPELLYSSLKNPDVPYTLLSDPTLDAAQAFHIAFHVDDETYAKELAWGVDLEKTTGTKAHALPVPSVFIVDTSGVIRFVYSNADYKVRLSADDLWRAAQPPTPRTHSTH
jgi:peroxiredoxin